MPARLTKKGPAPVIKPLFTLPLEQRIALRSVPPQLRKVAQLAEPRWQGDRMEAEKAKHDG